MGFWSWWVAQMCRTASDQILELLGGSNIGGQILGAARCLALLTKGHIGACQKQENQSWWAAQTCRKYKGPDPLASWGGNQIIAASRCFGAVAISMWASDRCLGIFQSHSGLWNISAWESDGFLGFWSWWVAQICQTARNQILGLLGGVRYWGADIGAARRLALLTKGQMGACQKQENQSGRASQTCRKCKGPDP